MFAREPTLAMLSSKTGKASTIPSSKDAEVGVHTNTQGLADVVLHFLDGGCGVDGHCVPFVWQGYSSTQGASGKDYFYLFLHV